MNNLDILRIQNGELGLGKKIVGKVGQTRTSNVEKVGQMKEKSRNKWHFV